MSEFFKGFITCLALTWYLIIDWIVTVRQLKKLGKKQRFLGWKI